ncbi:MAG: hypothetical protein FWH21_08920 [Kiritimatiellaeota bacterium]|nr:hypothetical protein [Kiritimatiellota bacterium]
MNIRHLSFLCFLFFLFVVYILCKRSISSECIPENKSPGSTWCETMPPDEADNYEKWLMERNEKCWYAELDLTGNGVKDIIISDPIYTGGKGGFSWNVYLYVSTNQYKRLPVEIFGWPLTVEEYYDSTLIWAYSHISGRQGAIQYWEINKRGECIESARLEIYTGDGGTDIGNAVYDAIFREKRLELKITPANDMPDNTINH